MVTVEPEGCRKLYHAHSSHLMSSYQPIKKKQSLSQPRLL